MAYPHERDDDGVVTQKNPNADNQAGAPEEASAVTGRANDLGSVTQEPALANSTFRDRIQTKPVTSQQAGTKAIGDMTKAELLDEAERRSVDVPSSATKAEIVEALGG